MRFTAAYRSQKHTSRGTNNTFAGYTAQIFYSTGVSTTMFTVLLYMRPSG